MTSPSSSPLDSDRLELVSNVPNSSAPIDSNNQEKNLRQQGPALSTKAKLISWAITFSMLPVLFVGTATYLTSETLRGQIQHQQQTDSPQWGDIQATIKQRIPVLLIGTGVFALTAGSLALWLLSRELRPFIQAAHQSNQLVNRLYRLETSSDTENESQDKLWSLVNNINLITAQIPEIIHSQEHEAARAELLMQFIGQLHVALSEEDLLKTTVAEVRQILQTDRVTIFALNPDGDGSFIAESVAPGYPKLQWSTLHDPCFREGYQEQYRQGRVRAIDNIYQAGITDCHIGLLERFAVKANLVAPILQKDKLFGLLIAHQCTRPREWHPSDIELIRQLALQVGYAIDRAKVTSQLDSQVNHFQLLLHFTQLLRGSLQTEEILANSVQESRKVLRADRVIVYRFDDKWQGMVAAEAVQPGLAKMLWANIADPCFADSYVEQYRRGRVQAIQNVYEAGLTDCHLQQLEKYAVQANLVVPILVGKELYGLLIAHQCSGPRRWQPSEVELFTQIGLQVGHALAQASILTQTKKDAIDNTTQIQEDQQQHLTLKKHVQAYLQDNQSRMQLLVQGANQHKNAAQSAYTKLQTILDFAQDINTIVRQFQAHNHEILSQVETAQDYLNQHVNHPHQILMVAPSIIAQLQELKKSTQQISQLRILVSQLTSQMQLQAMKITAEATHHSVSPQELSSITQNINNITQRMDECMTQMKPLIESLQGDLQQQTAILKPFTQEASNSGLPQIQPQQLSSNLNSEITQLNIQIAKINQLVGNHIQTSSTASHQVFELNQFLRQLTSQTQSMEVSIQQLETAVSEERP